MTTAVASCFPERYWALPLEWLTDGRLAHLLSRHEPPANRDEGPEPRAARRAGARRGKAALVPITGLLTEHDSWFGTSYAEIRGAVRELAREPDISTIVLAFHSPGGGVYGVHETVQALREAKQTKRLVAIASAEAASAAYWLASQAHELIVSPSGQVGSLGVFALHVDARAANDQMGLAFNYVVSSNAPYKVELSSNLALSDDARAAMQHMVDSYEGDFIRDAATGRGVTQAVVRAQFGQGRTLRAADAVKAGMADRVAAIDDLLQGIAVEERRQEGSARAADVRLALRRLALEQ